MNRLAPLKVSRPTVASRSPTAAAISALTMLPLPMVATSSTPSRARAAYSGGPKSSAQPATSGASRVSPDDGDGGADEGADGGDAERGAGPALLGQREAVEDGDHRGRLTREPEQHRGDGAAVLGAVVDAGQHDDRRDGVDRVGDRQQDRDGRSGAEAGQHTDEHADQHADQAVEQVPRLGDERRTRRGRRRSPRGSPSQNRWGRGMPQRVEEEDVERSHGRDGDDDGAAPGLAAEEPQPDDAQQQGRDLEADQRHQHAEADERQRSRPPAAGWSG